MKKRGNGLVKAGFILFALGMLVNVISFVYVFATGEFGIIPVGFIMCGIGMFLIIVGAITSNTKSLGDEVEDIKNTIKSGAKSAESSVGSISESLKNIFSTEKTPKKKTWKCEYCGSVNNDEDHKCTSCGATKI